LNEATRIVNKATKHIMTRDITETNNPIKATSIWVAKQLGLKKLVGWKKVEPWWKRRTERDFKNVRKDIEIFFIEYRMQDVKKLQINITCLLTNLHNYLNILKNNTTLFSFKNMFRHP